MTLKFCQLIEYEIRKNFMKKSYKKCALKATPRPHFNLVNNPKQPLHPRGFKIKRINNML